MSSPRELPPKELGWTAFFTQQWMLLQNDNPKLVSFRPARIVSDLGSEYVLADTLGEHRAKLGGRLLATLDPELRPTVGDWALVDTTLGELSRIEHVFDRASALTRKAIGRSSKGQTIAANVDVVFIVSALAPPEAGVHAQQRGLNLGRIERYLKAALTSVLEAVVVVNKADLDPDLERVRAELASSLRECDVVFVSARTGAGIEELASRVGSGRTAVFVGSSGVGKSSLVNRLLGSDVQRVSEIREEDARGRHTTTSRHLLELPRGGLLIDTPGMRELGLFGGDVDERARGASHELDALASQCRFADCSHRSEPGCAVLAAIATGELEHRQLEHEKKLEREMAWQKERHDAQERHKARIRHKALSKFARKIQATKGNRS